MTPELKSKIDHWGANSEGWTSLDRLYELAEIIIKSKPSVVVELGVFGGRSLIPQGMALREAGGGKVYGIDPWHVDATLEGEIAENQKWWQSIDIENIHRLCMAKIWSEKLNEHVVIIRAESQNCCPVFSDFSIDLLTIDGNHSEVASVRDVELWLPKVHQGGMIIFDDADWPSTQKAIAILSKCCELIKDSGNYRIYRKK